MQRLKDKLGTRTVPTGEVDFVDAEAYLLAGGDGNGRALDGRGDSVSSESFACQL